MIDPNYIPVEDHPTLFRDRNTGAIINIDKNKAIKARKKREEILAEKQEVESLKAEVAEIKDMLKQLLER